MTISGLTLAAVNANDTIKQAMQDGIARRVSSKIEGVELEDVTVAFADGSVIAVITIRVPKSEASAQTFKQKLSTGETSAGLRADIAEEVKAVPGILSIASGDLTFSTPTITVSGEHDSSTTQVLLPEGDGANEKNRVVIAATLATLAALWSS